MRAPVLLLLALAAAVPASALEPVDPTYPQQWALPRIGAPAAWDVTRGRKTVLLAVLGTGASSVHLDAPKVLRVDLGYDFVNRDALAADDNGRGTELTGVVAAAWNGVQIAGLAPGVSVVPVKILDANGSGSFAMAAAGIDWAVAKGARVILFAASATASDGGVRMALERAQAAGVLVVAPAGNDHAGVAFPAYLDSVLSVGAIDQADQTAYFSNWGPELDLVAPGVAIRATGATGSVSRSGTDFAAAHVAAVAALYLSLHPDATLTQVRSRLFQSAEDLGPGGYDNHYGWGLVRADWTVE